MTRFPSRWTAHLTRHLVSRVLQTAAVVMAIRLVTLTEEEEEGGGDFGSAARRPPMRIPVDAGFELYKMFIDEALMSHSRLGRMLRQRYIASSFIAIASAGAVPVVVATEAPGWVVATLGAIAALVQSGQQVLKDNTLSLKHHQVAQKLSAARRQLVIDLDRGDRNRAHNTFTSRCEDVLADANNSIVDMLESKPSTSYNTPLGSLENSDHASQ